MPQSDPRAHNSIGTDRAAYPLRYFAWLYSPEPQQRVLKALWGVESEIGDSLRSGLDHQVGHSRLQWWREECERYAAGSPVHPLTRELAATTASRADLTGFADTAVWDLARATFETRRELTAYCERWAAAMIQPLMPDMDWRALGAALRELEMLADLASEGHSGRVRLPLDELDRIKVDPAMLARPPWPEALAHLLRSRHEALRSTIIRSVGAVEAGPSPPARGMLVWALLACKISRRCQADLPDSRRTRWFDGISDAWFAWRIARSART